MSKITLLTTVAKGQLLCRALLVIRLTVDKCCHDMRKNTLPNISLSEIPSNIEKFSSMPEVSDYSSTESHSLEYGAASHTLVFLEKTNFNR